MGAVDRDLGVQDSTGRPPDHELSTADAEDRGRLSPVVVATERVTPARHRLPRGGRGSVGRCAPPRVTARRRGSRRQPGDELSRVIALAVSAQRRQPGPFVIDTARHPWNRSRGVEHITSAPRKYE